MAGRPTPRCAVRFAQELYIGKLFLGPDARVSEQGFEIDRVSADIPATPPPVPPLVTYLRRREAVDLSYYVEFADRVSADGATGWHPSTKPETVTRIDSAWERVDVDDAPPADGSQRYGRVRLEYAPGF